MKANDGMKDMGLLCRLLLHTPYVCLTGEGKGLFINTILHVNCKQLEGTEKRKKISQEGNATTEQDSLEGVPRKLLKTT